MKQEATHVGKHAIKVILFSNKYQHITILKDIYVNINIKDGKTHLWLQQAAEPRQTLVW